MLIGSWDTTQAHECQEVCQQGGALLLNLDISEAERETTLMDAFWNCMLPIDTSAQHKNLTLGRPPGLPAVPLAKPASPPKPERSLPSSPLPQGLTLSGLSDTQVIERRRFPSPSGPPGRLSSSGRAHDTSTTARTEPTSRGPHLGLAGDNKCALRQGSQSDRGQIALMRRGMLTIRCKAALIEIFRRYDDDADGALRPDQFLAYLSKCRGITSVDAGERTQIRSRYHHNSLGNLSMQGFLEYYAATTEDEGDTWRDLRSHGYDDHLQLPHTAVYE